eukprot:TRINITY_DN18569_c0_g1_i1.p1 TRINITY_DN18569_c0_g1~~TRINITY_DN18569_c0_g1_i1.p1  ORF type:complete len:265 (+),score=41.19 TRINITY_DN18569_c0_g1_i1:66-797(+)
MASSALASATRATSSFAATSSSPLQNTQATTFAIAPAFASTRSHHRSPALPSPTSRQNVQSSHSSIAPGCHQLRRQTIRLQCRVARKSTGPVIRAERSYVMIKPDGVQRGLVGEIITRFERKGFQLKGLKLFQTPEDLAKEHYKDLSSKPFYGKLVDYIISGPVVAMIWEGDGVVASARKLIGATNPLAAEPGTIRGDFAVEVGRNVVHGSDSPENGEREIGLWFEETEVVEWTRDMTPWLRE